MLYFNSKNVTVFGIVLSVILLIITTKVKSEDIQKAKQPESPLESVGLNIKRKSILPSEENSKEKHDEHDKYNTKWFSNNESLLCAR